MPVTFTTDLPDEDHPVLGNGVEDEIQVDRETQATNYGDVRIQTRETGQSTWDTSAVGFDEQTVAHDTVTTTISDREDGEAYEVRLRTETEHRTGSWTAPVAITTKFPGAANPISTPVDRTTVDVTWTDQSDNEDGFCVERRELLNDGSLSSWRVVADLPPNTTAYTDSDAKPGTEFHYRIRAYTEDAVATSSTVTTTTPAARFETTSRAASGWTVEVDHPSGQTLRPDLLGEPVWNPEINGIPTLTFEIRGGDEWQSDALQQATVRAWRDGERLPVSQLSSTTVTPEGVELTARGAPELDTVVRRSVGQRESHEVIRDLVQQETDIATNIDEPPTSVDEDVLVQSLTAADELEDALAEAIQPTDPLKASGSSIDPTPTAITLEAEDNFDLGGEVPDDAASAGEAEFLTAGSGFDSTATVTIGHRIPASEVGIAFRAQAGDDADGDGFFERPGVTVEVDGETVYQEIEGSTSLSDYRWENGTGAVTDLEPGDHTIRFAETGADNGGDYFIDVVTLYDDRFTQSFPDTLDGDYLPGPERFPASITRAFDDVPQARQVVGGRFAVGISSTANNQAVSISNDQGQSYTTAQNATSVDASFASGSTQVRGRVTISNYGTRSDATPTQGFKATSLDSIDLFADLDNTPLIDNQTFEGPLIDVISQIADESNFLTELTYEDGQGPTLQLTTPGQRTADSDPALADYSVSVEQDTTVRKAIIRGRSQPEEETLSASVGSAIALDHDFVEIGSERVVSESDGAVYDLDADYAIDWQAGEFTALSGGEITDGESLTISYERETRGVFTADDFSGDPTETFSESVPAVATEAAATNVARVLVQNGAKPIKTVSVEIDKRPTNISLVDDLQLKGVPLPQRLEIQSLEDTPSGTRLQLGSRRPVETVLNRIRSQLDQTSRAV